MFFCSSYMFSYPQPEKDFGFMRTTYDPSSGCQACAAGLVQTAPFRLLREPKWRHGPVVQLNWVPSELFVTPELWETVFRPIGVDSREVRGPGNKTLTNTLQLVVDDFVDISTDGLASETCSQCGTAKYEYPEGRGFPAPQTEPQSPIVRSRQVFGSGLEANNFLIISKELRSALKNASVRGVSYWPCDPISAASV